MTAHKFDIEDKKQEIRLDLNRLAKHIGRTPTSKDYKQFNRGKWSYSQMRGQALLICFCHSLLVNF